MGDSSTLVPTRNRKRQFARELKVNTYNRTMTKIGGKDVARELQVTWEHIDTIMEVSIGNNLRVLSQG